MNSSLRITTVTCLGLLMASCDSPVKDDGTAEKQSEAAQARMGDLKSDHKKEVDSVKADLESAEGELETLRLELQNASESAKSANEEIERLKLEFEAYKTKYRVSVREKGKGRDLGDLALANGRTLKKAVIREIDDTGIMIAHAAGIGRIPFPDLSAELQEEFAYDPGAAERQAKADAVQQAAIRQKQAVAAQLAAKNQNKKDLKFEATESIRESADNTAEIATLRSKMAAAERRISAIRTEISDRKYKQTLAKIRGRSASHTAPIKKLEAEKQGLETAISQAEIRISTLKSGR